MLEWNDWAAFETYVSRLTGSRIERQRAVAHAMLKLRLRGRRIVFVDFCPGGVVLNRLDVSWIQQGICTYRYFASFDQQELFDSIAIGDLLVIKKNVSMDRGLRLYAYGKVERLALSDEGDRILMTNWSHEQGQIEVPFADCDKMVNIRDVATVQKTMPTIFWHWLLK